MVKLETFVKYFYENYYSWIEESHYYSDRNDYYDNDDNDDRYEYIEEAEIKEIDLNTFFEDVFKYIVRYSKDISELSEIDKYCIIRIGMINKIYDRNLYDIEIKDDYYQQYIEGISFKNMGDIYLNITILLSIKDDRDKINYVLNLEYNRLLPSLEKLRKVEIIEIDSKDVYVAAPNHADKVQKVLAAQLDETIFKDFYSNHKYPICICIRKGNKYHLIDGYHRYFQSKNDNRDKINIILLD